jgi:hypothetical protein
MVFVFSYINSFRFGQFFAFIFENMMEIPGGLMLLDTLQWEIPKVKFTLMVENLGFHTN